MLCCAVEAEAEAESRKQKQRALGETHDEVIRNTVRLAPGAHDKGIVIGNHNDLIDTLGLQSILLLDEGGNVLLGAGGREGTRDCYQDNLLVLELCSV